MMPYSHSTIHGTWVDLAMPPCAELRTLLWEQLRSCARWKQDALSSKAYGRADGCRCGPELVQTGACVHVDRRWAGEGQVVCASWAKSPGPGKDVRPEDVRWA
eukprot:1147183-Pelagomonas_calceolata.AAC.1